MTKCIAGAVTAWVTALFLCPMPSAGAHAEFAVYALTVVDRVDPAIEGLHVRVVQLTAPVMVVENRTGRSLVVLGRAGEPFLRIGRGRVEANLESPTAYVASDPTGDRPIPPGLDPDGPPRWSLQARGDSWSWFDPRLTFTRGGPSRWEVDARLGDEAVRIEGGFEPVTGHGHFLTELVSPPKVPGVEINLFDGSVPALFARNTTKTELEVPGREGEPFLRIGPRGVFGNVRSPSFYTSGQTTVRSVPADADPRAKPRWKQLSPEPVWAWLEYRARLPAGAEQRSALGTERRTVLRWTTPLELGDQEIELEGRVEWVPPRRPAAVGTGSDEERGWLVPVATAFALAAGAAFLLQARRTAAIRKS